MDSQKRDESRDRRREEALARRMGEALDQLGPRNSGECPDAELIAAYHDGALQPDEIAQWESHFAACSRCRKILLVLAASVDTPLAEKEVAHLGQLVAAARSPREAARTAKSARPDRLDWRVRWLAPALGIAAVLAVWFAMRPPWRTGDQNPSGTLIAQAPKSEPQRDTELRDQEQFSKVAPKKSLETDAVAPLDSSVAKAKSPNPATDMLARNRSADRNAIGAVTPSAGAAGGTFGNERKDETELKSAPAAAPPPPRSPLALPLPKLGESLSQEQAKAQVARQEPSATQPTGSANQSVVVTEGAPEVSTTAGAVSDAPARDKQALAGSGSAVGGVVGTRNIADLPLNGRNYRELSKLDAATGGAVLIKPSSGTILWRVGNGGSIERSSDAGRTWILQASPLQEDWLAGAAVSGAICWIAGRNGAIARTTDGEHWEKIAPPPLAAAASGKLPDWVGVTAADARTATVAASDQRRYITQDGGKTWRAQ